MVDRADKQPSVAVSIVIPCRNEIRHIEKCLDNIFRFDPPEGGFEVIVVDGMSDDGTREFLERAKRERPGLVVVDNPRKTVPHGMNRGILRARGEYIVRTDVRCIHPATYLLDLLSLSRETNADNVGGVLMPEGASYAQKCIAFAYKSPIAMGGALRDRGNFHGETDTVYGGCFKRSRLMEIGMYDEKMTRNQDDELSFRLRKAGGKIVQSGKIRVRYFPRDSFARLFKQFMQYGYWKVFVIERHPRQASPRHFAPALLVAGYVALGISALFSPLGRTALLGYIGVYLGALSAESTRLCLREGIRYVPGVLASICCTQVGFGVGFIAGTMGKLTGSSPDFFESLSR